MDYPTNLLKNLTFNNAATPFQRPLNNDDIHYERYLLNP